MEKEFEGVVFAKVDVDEQQVRLKPPKDRDMNEKADRNPLRYAAIANRTRMRHPRHAYLPTLQGWQKGRRRDGSCVAQVASARQASRGSLKAPMTYETKQNIHVWRESNMLDAFLHMSIPR